MSIAEKLTAIAENEQKVFDAGKQAEYDRFWDLFQDYGKRNHYCYAFSYYNFNDDTFNPKYPIKTDGSEFAAQHMFYGCKGITDTKVDIYLSYNPISAFQAARDMKTIRKLIVTKNIQFTSTFVETNALENITFEGVIGNGINFASCTNLSRESITNIIEHLASDTSGKTVTFSKTAKEAAFTAEEWTALTNTKSNWTIALA